MINDAPKARDSADAPPSAGDRFDERRATRRVETGDIVRTIRRDRSAAQPFTAIGMGRPSVLRQMVRNSRS